MPAACHARTPRSTASKNRAPGCRTRGGVEHVVDELRQLGPGAGFVVRDEASRILLHEAAQQGLLGPVALVVDTGVIRGPLGLPADALDASLPRW